ncbi:MAG: hypothetical protein D6696_19495 [Acidobacteria bacterium]|nr:MAG: hypothetical protein D6696_19495 [Acidobacteriota bacterium]
MIARPSTSLSAPIAAALLLALCAPAAAQVEAPLETHPEIDTRGLIYGKVLTTRGETYEGRLRWDGEESFWGDFFNGTKDELPFFDRIPDEQQRRSRPIRVFGITVGSRWERISDRRSTMARFGDVAAIEPRRSDNVVLHMKGGDRIELDGGSNDIGADVEIWDRQRGEVTVPWHRVERIELGPAPSDLPVEAYRLKGKVTSTAGTFEGFIEWDNDERLSDEILDGDDPDGKRHKIPMGDIRLIERHSRSSARVVMKDGTELVLDDTNDVDAGNRGIVIEDPRYGRVELSWSAFVRLELSDERSCGPPYQDFEPGTHLRGTVTTRGKQLRGRLVYDVDESETWEFLNGEHDDGIEFDVPFALIRSITPIRDAASRVELISGASLELSGTTDVGGDNAGVLVIAGGEAGTTTYVPWDDVDRIDFEH